MPVIVTTEKSCILQQLNHVLFWMKKASRVMSYGVYCVLASFDSLVIEDSRN